MSILKTLMKIMNNVSNHMHEILGLIFSTKLDMFKLKHHLYYQHADNLDYTLSLNKLTIMDIGMKSLSRTVERFISKSGHLERGEHRE